MKIYLIAGEESGDLLGYNLMSGLKKIIPDIEFCGVGGSLMESQGLKSIFKMSELSVIGIFEILPNLFKLIKRKNQVIDDIIRVNPDALITIDSPDFCLRVAKKVKQKTSIPTIHYVAPTVWAWRKRRALKMAKYIDHVLALFPFEKSLLLESGLSCDFVGHPIVGQQIAKPNEVTDFRKKFNLGTKKIILILPGSRIGEVKRLTDIFKETLNIVSQQFPEFALVIPTTKSVESLVKELTNTWHEKPIILANSTYSYEVYNSYKKAAFKEATVALAASGTVSLELATNSVPMVIAYDVNFLSRVILKFLLKIKTVTLVNIVTGTDVVPEFLGAKCQPEAIAEALIDLLHSKELRNKQIESYKICMARLVPEGDLNQGDFAAAKVIEHLNYSRKTL